MTKAGASNEEAYQQVLRLSQRAKSQGLTGLPMHGVVLELYESEKVAENVRNLIYRYYQMGQRERVANAKQK